MTIERSTERHASLRGSDLFVRGRAPFALHDMREYSAGQAPATPTESGPSNVLASLKTGNSYGVNRLRKSEG
jgi:hypothetical protein